MRRRHSIDWTLPILMLVLGACAATVDEQDVEVQQEELFILQPKLWPEGSQIPVCWENHSGESCSGCDWTRDAVQKSWEAHSSIRFTGWKECEPPLLSKTQGIVYPPGIRIEIADERPRVRVLGRALSGMPSGMTLNFTLQDWGPSNTSATREQLIRRYAIHEFGHALGFAHEQDRKSANGTLEAPPACLGQLSDDDFGQVEGDVKFSSWDSASVMNYCSESHDKLSRSDTAGVHALYGTLELRAFGYGAGTWRVDRHLRLFGDVNGDGRDDLVGFGEDGVYVSLSQCASTASNSLAPPVEQPFTAATPWLSDLGYSQGWRVDRHVRMLADVNGDGKADIVAFGASQVFVSLSTGSGFGSPFPVMSGFAYDQGYRIDQHPRAMADVDGDKRLDIIAFADDGVYVALRQDAPPLIAPTDVAPNVQPSARGTVAAVAAAAAVDTGVVQFAGVAPAAVARVRPLPDLPPMAGPIYFAAPQRWIAGYATQQGWSAAKHVRKVIDLDGDGKADIVGFGDTGVIVSLSNGQRFLGAQLAIADYGYDAGGWRVEKHLRFVADVDKDRKPDIVAIGDDGIFVSRFVAAVAGGPGERLVTFAPITYTQGFGYNAGWRVDTHPRMLADATGSGHLSIVGFGPRYVEVAGIMGDRYAPPQRYALRYGPDDGYNGREFPRTVAALCAGDAHHIVGFAKDGVHATHLRDHIVQ